MRKIIVTGAAALMLAAGTIATTPLGNTAEAHNLQCHHGMVETPVHQILPDDQVYWNGRYLRGAPQHLAWAGTRLLRSAVIPAR